jgi:hypothetical protein
MKAITIALLATTAIGTVVLNPTTASAGEVYNRELNQQYRIYKGVENGQISAREFRNLEIREARLDAQRRYDLYKDGGHLTAQDRARLNARENRISNSIYRDRHN